MTDEFSPILRTKLHRPRLTSDLVLRPRLLDQLDGGIDRWLTLVCAPAGFGKTTLVCSWIEGLTAKLAPIPVAWLSLDKDDSEVVRFTRYLIAALRTLFAGAGEETLQLLMGFQLPPLELISTSLSNEIIQLPERFVLVLDDYQMIRGEAVPNLLNELLQHWPQPLHLVLITRNNPPLPLPRLRANGFLTEIRSNDLRFDRAETAAFLNQHLKVLLNKQAEEVINERTEGWIGALRLATLSLRSATNVNERILGMAGSEENITDYLADEVLAHQFPVIQKFLIRTSVLDRFCIPLCEEVIGELDPAWNVQACLDWLKSEGLFVISLDDQQYWYRFHHLFLDLLKNRAWIELGPEQVANLHRRAADWFARQGMPDQALHHSLEAGDYELAAQLMAVHLRDLLNREDRPALERWLSLLPEEVIETRPELLIIKAWVYQFSWQLDAQSKVVQQIEALLAANEEKSLPDGILKTLHAQIAGMKAQYAYFSNQPDLAQAYGREALANIPDSWTFLRGGMMFYLGLSLQAQGEGHTAERLLLDHYETLNDKTNTYTLRLLHSLCFIYLNKADLDQVYQTAQGMLSLAEAGGLVMMQGWAHSFLGTVLYQWDHLEAAAGHFGYLVDHRFSTQAMSSRDGITGLALIHQIRGESAMAWKMVDLLSRIDLERLGAEANQTRSLRARLKLLEGDLETAMRWAEGFSTPVSSQPLTWLETPHLTQVRILLARRFPADVDKAHQVLDELADIAEGTHNTRFMIEILAMRALAWDAQGDAAAALDTLQQAVELARPGGFIRVFVELGPSMQKLFVELPRTAHLAGTIRKILDAFPDQDSIRETDETSSLIHPSSNGRTLDLVEPLTTREREILLLLREPASLKNIAANLSVSYATVKRHTINIYGKLGVNSRWDAVTKGAELGLLSNRS